MKRFAKWPVGYAIVSFSTAFTVSMLLLINPAAAAGPGAFSAALFFCFVVSYYNCLPLAIVSIFLFFRKESRRYSLISFASIVCVLYFVVKVFGKSV